MANEPTLTTRAVAALAGCGETVVRKLTREGSVSCVWSSDGRRLFGPEAVPQIRAALAARRRPRKA